VFVLRFFYALRERSVGRRFAFGVFHHHTKKYWRVALISLLARRSTYFVLSLFSFSHFFLVRFLLFISLLLVSVCHGDEQLNALLDFFNATGGSNWKNNANWDPMKILVEDRKEIVFGIYLLTCV
jgi:hypothetical protein